MVRPKKEIVDYFPHMVDHGKTMFILEQKYGNDGYAFWFKLLEMLGKAKGHYLDFNDDTAWEFLQAKTRLDGDLCAEILDKLAKLGAVDPELWSVRVVWSQNFVDGIAGVYQNRRTETPSRPSFYIQKPATGGVSTGENPQTIVEETIVKESREEAPPPNLSLDEITGLATLKAVANYPFNYNADLQHLRGLFIEFPDIDVLGEIARWAHRKQYDDPLKPGSKPRSQIRNWMLKAREFGRKKGGPTPDANPDDYYRETEELAARQRERRGI